MAEQTTPTHGAWRNRPDIRLGWALMPRRLRGDVDSVTAFVELMWTLAGEGACDGGGCSTCTAGSCEESGKPLPAVAVAALEHLFTAQPTGVPALDRFGALAAAGKVRRADGEALIRGVTALFGRSRVATWSALLGLLQGVAGPAMSLLHGVMTTPDGHASPTAQAQRAAWGAGLLLTELAAHPEPWRQRGAVLLPLDDLYKFGLTDQTGGDGAKWAALLAHLAEQARKLVRGGQRGLTAWPPGAQRAAAVIADARITRLERLPSSVQPWTNRPALTWLQSLRRLPAVWRSLRHKPRTA